MKTTHDVLERVRAEYREMPGMRLTAEQVQRLFGIERMVCKAALDSLVDSKFLCVKADGTYARVAWGDVTRPRPVKVDLGLERRAVAAS
jgi:hypothetical protein